MNKQSNIKKIDKIINKNSIRRIIQLIFFIIMPGAFVAGFTGVKYIFTWIGEGHVLEMNNFVKVLTGLVLLTILFGRFFCGYVCAFGSTGDFVYYLSGIIQKKLLKRRKQISIPNNISVKLQIIKYINLVAIILFCTAGIYEKTSGLSPWDVFSRITAFSLVPKNYWIGVIILLLIIVGMAVKERFFCQYLCPLGAVFSLLPIIPFLTLRRNEPNCIKGCNACANRCPVSLKLSADGERMGECISCEKCLMTCPKKNITINIPVIVKFLVYFGLGVYAGL